MNELSHDLYQECLELYYKSGPVVLFAELRGRVIAGVISDMEVLELAFAVGNMVGFDEGLSK